VRHLTITRSISLGGHLKTGHTWPLQTGQRN
jgi:hypothetical protein